MSVPYYLGAKNIAIRLGYKSPHVVHKLIIREALPCYKRAIRSRTGAYRTLCISESALTAWELSKGARFVAEKRARAANGQKDRRYALTAR